MVTRRRQRRVEASTDRVDVLRRRARRFARKGEHRKAALALRELVALTGDAASWAMLGGMLNRACRTNDAVHALKQAMWLHRRAGADLRARSVARLIVELDPFDSKAARYAA